MISFTIPGTPPSGNSYVRHTRDGRHYRSTDAKGWDESVAAMAAGRKLKAEGYIVRVALYLAKGQRGDADNFLKVLCDSLQRCGVIHSDAAIRELHVAKFRDAESPRTEISVEAI